MTRLLILTRMGSCRTQRREGSRPRDQWFAERSTDPNESLAISTMQTCSRRAGTRALPGWLEPLG